MIEFSWGHILVIAVVALIVIGPKELPTVLRTAGQWMGKVRRMASEFQSQFQEAMREAEMADVKQHFDDISTAAKEIPHFDPIGTVRKEIESAIAENPSPKVETAPPAVDTPPPPPPVIAGPAAGPQTAPADLPVQGPEKAPSDADKAEGRLS
jgi:sec-independent protein translocase protein TatB